VADSCAQGMWGKSLEIARLYQGAALLGLSTQERMRDEIILISLLAGYIDDSVIEHGEVWIWGSQLPPGPQRSCDRPELDPGRRRRTYRTGLLALELSGH